MKRKIKKIAWCLAICMCVLQLRLYSLSSNQQYAQSAQNQSAYTLSMCDVRGNIYDCNFAKMVNSAFEYVYIVDPRAITLEELLQQRLDSEQNIGGLYAKGKPFIVKRNILLNVPESIKTVKVPLRYEQNQLATHIIGYTQDNAGVCGIEKSYDKFLRENQTQIQLRYQADIAGRPVQAQNHFEIETKSSKKGVVLTLDRNVQEIVEKAFTEDWDKGAAVVMDVQSGKVRALASFPKYSPSNPAASLGSSDNPFVNRALSNYDVGSIFKLIVTACALEKYPGQNFSYTCTGQYDLQGQVFNCHKEDGHGHISLQKAIEESCNTFFIQLGMALPKEDLLSMAARFGIGKYNSLAESIDDGGGYLPTLQDIENDCDYANICFGQGKLMATPLQLTRVIAAIANGGNLVTPSLIEGISDGEGTGLEQPATEYAKSRIITQQTAETIKKYMIGVVAEGSGKKAAPEQLGAGGKTGTAQTGWSQDGESMVQGWFTGFYPADNPKYAIVILCENGQSGALKAGPIFKKIADELYEKGYVS